MISQSFEGAFTIYFFTLESRKLLCEFSDEKIFTQKKISFIKSTKAFSKTSTEKNLKKFPDSEKNAQKDTIR